MLAGISTDYYLRLEQGRDRTPSVQVAEALGRALRLDPDEAAYLHTLARPRPKRAPRPRAEKVPPGTVRLLASLTVPAFVQDRYLTVLAANLMAQGRSPNMRPGVNRLLAARVLKPQAPMCGQLFKGRGARPGQRRRATGAGGPLAKTSSLDRSARCATLKVSDHTAMPMAALTAPVAVFGGQPP
jgi:transcriptional regulator with XRE-family HTH domain